MVGTPRIRQWQHFDLGSAQQCERHAIGRRWPHSYPAATKPTNALLSCLAGAFQALRPVQ
eukprot:976976-Amphidinium_carterae.1